MPNHGYHATQFHPESERERMISKKYLCRNKVSSRLEIFYSRHFAEIVKKVRS